MKRLAKALKPKLSAPRTPRRVRICRVCGCTDQHACPGGCRWVAPDLCSQCVPEVQPKKGPAE